MNKQFRQLVSTEEFWKGIPEEFVWVVVDDGYESTNVSVYTERPIFNDAGWWFTLNGKFMRVDSITNSFGADIFKRPPFKSDSAGECVKRQSRVVLTDVLGNTRQMDWTNYPEGHIEDDVDKWLHSVCAQSDTFVLFQECKPITFIRNNLIDFRVEHRTL